MGRPLRLAALFLASTLAGVAFAQSPKQNQNPKADLVATTEAQEPEAERKALHVPPGFEIQLVAAEPDVYKPMNLAFDDRGRLWVTSSLEYPWPAKEGRPRRDKVTILEDFGTDGRARKVTTFVEGLNIPIGVLPVPGGALVHSIPNIWFFPDIDGDGKADGKEPYYGSIGFRDTHGMASAFSWGFDGWIYGCHGFNNDSALAGRDGKAINLSSGNTYRMRPDGSHIEQWTWGQVNPFGLSFDPLGNLFSCDCHTRPLFCLLRGAYYDSFGKPHDGLGYGPPMMSHDHYSTGIAGVTYYSADHFPPEWRDTIFVGNVVTSRVNHDKLQWRGSSPWAVEQPDFIVSDDPWFRPVDIELGPDGALYVADFYNRIIGHYEVPLTHPGRDRHRGRIWRIVYKGTDGKNPAPRMPHADFDKASDEELIADLARPSLPVRIRAANALARRGTKVVEAVSAAAKASSPESRVHANWILQRVHALDNDRLVAMARDGDRAVRVHAMHIAAERAELDETTHEAVTIALNDPDAFVRRAAADALSRHPDAAKNVRPLLNVRRTIPGEDTHLLHAVRMATRDQLRPGTPWPKVGDLGPDDAKLLADVAPGSHGKESAAFLMEYLAAHDEAPDTLLRYVHHIARWGDDATKDRLIAFGAAKGKDRPVLLASILKEFVRGLQEYGAPLPEATRKQAIALLDVLLRSGKNDQIPAGIELADTIRLPEAKPGLIALLNAERAEEGHRAAAAAALAAIDPAAAVPSLARTLESAAEPVGLRTHVANLLGKANRDDARAALLATLPTAPSQLQTSIAVALAPNRAGAQGLLAAVAAGKASPRLLQDRAVQVWLNQTGLPDLDERIAKLTAGLPAADERVQQLLERRRLGLAGAKGAADAGSAVFKKSCGVCHQIGGEGAKVGPQLDGVGIRGAERLLEDVLDPNRNVDQAFRMTTLALDDGRVLNGLLLREEGEILVLADSEGKEVRVPKKSVEERKVSALSPMPADMAERIPEADFYNLMSYLLAQKQKPESK